MRGALVGLGLFRGLSRRPLRGISLSAAMASTLSSSSAGATSAPTAATTVGGMTALDRTAFDETVKVPALRVPKLACNAVSKRLKRFLLRKRRVVPVVRDAADPDNSRLVLLSCPFSELPSELAEFARAQGATAAPKPHPVELTYQHLGADSVLRRILPAHVEVPGAFEVIGHIGGCGSVFGRLLGRPVFVVRATLAPPPAIPAFPRSHTPHPATPQHT